MADENVVEIVVRSKNEVKTGFDSVRTDSNKLGDDVGETFTKRFADKIINLRARIKTSIDKSGMDIGDSFGETIHKRITEKIKVAFSGKREKINVDVDVDVDKDKPSLIAKMGGLGKELGGKLTDGLGGSLSNFFSGDIISLIVKGLGAAALGAALGPVIGAGITAAILLALGGGVIGVGIASAFQDPRIQGAAGELKDNLTEIFKDFGEPFMGPVAQFLEDLNSFFDSQKDNFKALSEAFAPLTGDLGDGIIGALQNMLPGIVDAAEAAKPLFDTLADHLPKIGQAVGDFFRTISENGDGANEFFDDLLWAIEKIIPLLATVIGAFSDWYEGMKEIAKAVGKVFLGLALYAVNQFEMILAAAEAALGWIPGLGGKIREAQNKFRELKNKINEQLNGIHDVNVTVTITAMLRNLTGSTLSDSALNSAFRKNAGNAAGGIIGAATGGIHSGMRWVGEQGPELADLPAGTTVHSAADSQRMMRQASGGNGGGTLEFKKSGTEVLDALGEWVLEHLQFTNRTVYGGDVNNMLGVTG